MHTLLSADLVRRVTFDTYERERFGHEFHVDPAFRRALGEKFRSHDRLLTDLLERGPGRTSPLAAVENALVRRRRRTRAGLSRLTSYAARGTLAGTVHDLAPRATQRP